MLSLKKLNKTRLKHLRAEHFLYLVVISFLSVFLWWFVAIDYQGHPKQLGSLKKASTSTQNYKNIDISIARQAEFSSQAVNQVRDLGVKNSVRHYIFSFGVPHDNLTENGLMTLPLSPAPAAGYPVVVLLHGYANPTAYSTVNAYVPDMEFYSQNGYAVLKPDLRGQGFSLPDGQAEGAYYSMAYNTDTLSLVAAIKQTSYLNKDKINLWGHSMGAYVALRAAVVSKDIKNAILLSGPIGYIQDMFTAYIAISDTYNATAANIRLSELDQHGTPLTNPTYWSKVSPLSYLSDTKTYFQIHVGTNDNVVPPAFSKDFDEALTKDGKAHDYYVYSDAGHGLVPERSLIWQRSLSLLNKNN